MSLRTRPRAIVRFGIAGFLAAAVTVTSAPAAFAAPPSGGSGVAVPATEVGGDATPERVLAAQKLRQFELAREEAEKAERKRAKAEAEKAEQAKAEKERAEAAKARAEWLAAMPPCDQITNASIPTLVAEVFRCRLIESDLFGEKAIRKITAEAVAVAHCESLFDPNAIVFNGRYLHQRHPYTGYFYSAAGVFQFIRKTADTWIAGGYDNALDPTANIDAAARLYIANRKLGLGGWEDWACAAANDGFKATSVLPGWPGGPAELPDWAYQY